MWKTSEADTKDDVQRSGQQRLGTRHQKMMKAVMKTEDESLPQGNLEGNWIEWKSSTWQQNLTAIVASARFDALMATVVAINLITMAVEPEMPQAHRFFTSLDWFYNIIYTVEVSMRVSVYGRLYFINSFNILDLLIVVSGWITSFAEVIAGDSDGPFASMGALKVLRALRSFRLFRMIGFFEGVWIVFSSFLNCLKPLLWTCVFVMVIIFIFAMFAVELIGTSNSFKGVENSNLFKSTFPAMITLFQIMTLDDWRSITKPLNKAEWWTYLFFFTFLCISALALMNMVTAVVVENSMEHMKQDEDMVNHHVLEEHAREKEKIQSVLRFFRTADNAHQNAYDLSASPADLLKARSTWAALEEILDALDLHEEQEVMKLMVLLDADGNGDISVAELLEGLLELRVMTRDKHRVALLHAMESSDYKFSIIERSLAQTHAPVDIAASLHRIEDMLKEIGMAPAPSKSNSALSGSSLFGNPDYERPGSPPVFGSRPNTPQLLAPNSRPNTPMDSSRSNPGSRPGTPAGASSPHELRLAGQGTAAPQNTDREGAQEVMRELRLFRQALQYQGQELEQQGACIQRMQEAVAQLRQEQEEKARRHRGTSGSAAAAWPG